MIYNFKTKKALKFLLWLFTGLNAMLVCLFVSLQNSDVKIAVLGAVAMLLQVAHGVRVAFFNKTLVNMSLGFCKFQFMLLLLFMLIVAPQVGGTYGIIIFAVGAARAVGNDGAVVKHFEAHLHRVAGGAADFAGDRVIDSVPFCAEHPAALGEVQRLVEHVGAAPADKQFVGEIGGCHCRLRA